MEQQELSFIAGGNAKWYSHFGRQSGSFYKTKYVLTIQSDNCVPWYLYKWETYFHTKHCTGMLIAALFIIVKTWKQRRCPSIAEWINKWWYMHTMEYYSVLKRNELSSYEKTWRNLKWLWLSERSNLKRLHTVWFQLDDISAKQNYGENKKTSGFQCIMWREKLIERTQRLFITAKLFCLKLWWQIHVNTFVQIHRRYTTKSET